MCVYICIHVGHVFYGISEEGVKSKEKQVYLSVILSDEEVDNTEQDLLLETHTFNHPLGLL